MKRVAIDDIDHPWSISLADVIRPPSDPLGTTVVAVNYFELAPGETVGFDYHRHVDQEAVCDVQSGTATSARRTARSRSGRGRASGSPRRAPARPECGDRTGPGARHRRAP